MSCDLRGDLRLRIGCLQVLCSFIVDSVSQLVTCCMCEEFGESWIGVGFGCLLGSVCCDCGGTLFHYIDVDH